MMGELNAKELPSDLCNLAEFLRTDDRPSAILDTERISNDSTQDLSLVYKNAGFERLGLTNSEVRNLLEKLTAHDDDGSVESPITALDGRLWRLRPISHKWMALVGNGITQNACRGNSAPPSETQLSDSGIGLDESPPNWS